MDPGPNCAGVPRATAAAGPAEGGADVDDLLRVLRAVVDAGRVAVALALALLEPELAAHRHLVVLRGEAEPARVVLKPEAAVAVT